jgi:transposase
MSRFYPYSPEQGYLVPPNVADELGSDHLCFFIRQVVRQLDLSVFAQSYSPEGGMLYAPELMLSVWLYAYATGMTSARRLSQRLGEDLALRYLAGGARVDNWALSAFRRRHALALNDAFTQVLEMARSLGLGKLGRVAIDATRIQANASRNRVDTEQTLRNERAKLRRNIRRWQQACDKDDSEPGGLTVRIEDAERKLAELPRRLERLRKSGLRKLSRTDPDARFLRCRGGFELGYTAEIAMSEDHLIVAQRVTQQPTDNASLVPMVEQVKLECGSPPEQLLADSGYFSVKNLEWLEQEKINAYVPDSNLARALNLRKRCKGRARAAAHKRMRQKLRSPAGRQAYAQRKTIVEPGFGTLKAQRDMRQFRTRGKETVTSEFTLANIGFNLTRMYSVQHSLGTPTPTQKLVRLAPEAGNRSCRLKRDRSTSTISPPLSLENGYT